MNASIKQIHQMLKEVKLEYFVGDDDGLTLLRFSRKGQRFSVFLIHNESHLRLLASDLPVVARTSRLAAAVNEDLMELQQTLDISVAYREPDSGDLMLKCEVTCPQVDDEPQTLAGLLDVFCDDVMTACVSINAVLESGKTKRERTMDKSIERLFDKACEEYEQDQKKEDKRKSDA